MYALQVATQNYNVDAPNGGLVLFSALSWDILELPHCKPSQFAAFSEGAPKIAASYHCITNPVHVRIGQYA